jgi:hypothetical protein
MGALLLELMDLERGVLREVKVLFWQGGAVGDG